MYKIIHYDFTRREGVCFLREERLELERDGLRHCGIDGGAKEFATVEEALAEGTEMLNQGERAPDIRIVEVIPFDESWR